MNEKALQLAKKHAEDARKSGRSPVRIVLKPGETSSLSKMIKTKEQADFFMKLLRGL